MFKSLKDARRRVVETVLEKVGASEQTEDEVFDTHAARFETMCKDMNECGSALTSTLTNQKVFFSEATEFAKVLDRIYTQNSNPEYWPNTSCAMTQGRSAAAYYEALNSIHEIYRCPIDQPTFR